MKVYFWVLLSFCVITRSTDSEEWTHHTVLDGDGRFFLHWRPPKTKNSHDEITFKVEVQAHGYVGFGLSPNGGMAGSDIVTAWIKDGKTYFQDRYATKNGLPRVDKKQDWELKHASENETHTIFKFSRKLDTCDTEDMVIDDSTMRVIFAYSEEDPEGQNPFYHGGKRGTKSVMLLQTKIESSQHLEDPSIEHWDVKLENFTIPSIETMYWCKIFRTPQLSQKNHIVYVKPIIQEGNEEFVHHMLLYECLGATPDEYEEYVDYHGHQCHRPNMPEVMKKCEGVSIAWAVGGNDVVFPEHVGLPLNPAPGQYFLLEMHYDNPQRHIGVVDGSGLRIYYTPKLRKYDAGCLMLGATISPRMFIPPDQKEYTVTGHSNPECFAQEIPNGGLKALGVLLHAHLAGKRITARHFRKNKELPPFAVENNYDFNYQEYRYYTNEVDILQGDQITVECTYNTSKRTRTTLAGESTREEMCLAFILYYPRMNRYASLSVPSLHNINKALDTSFTMDDIRTYRIYSALMRYNWENVNISDVEHAMRFTKHNSHCYLGDGERNTVKSLISYPEDIKSYVVESSCGENEKKEEMNPLREDPEAVKNGSRMSLNILHVLFTVISGIILI